MQPALDTVQQTLGNINLEKWKRGNIREEAGDNIGKILKDLKETLPPLMNDADAARVRLARRCLSLATLALSMTCFCASLKQRGSQHPPNRFPPFRRH